MMVRKNRNILGYFLLHGPTCSVIVPNVDSALGRLGGSWSYRNGVGRWVQLDGLEAETALVFWFVAVIFRCEMQLFGGCDSGFV